jgi:hypothetical protein
VSKILLTGLLLFGWFWTVNAQLNCSEQLRQAERRYDEGLLDDIPMMLRNCFNSGFTREEKVNAYRLLILTHLFSDNRQGADDEMYRFLRDFPEYNITPADPKEFSDLYLTYRTEPVLKIEPYLGINYSKPYVFEYFSVSDLNQSVPIYSSNFGFSGGTNFTDRINNNIDGSIGLAIHYSSVGLYYQVFDYTHVNGTYTDIYAGVPISMRYNLSYKGFDFFAKAGMETQYLLYSQNSLVRGFTAGGDNIVETVDFTPFRKRYDFRPFIGIGLTPEFGNIRLMFDAGVRFSTIIPVDKDSRYSGNELLEKFYFIEDKWMTNHFYLNVTYIFSIYKPSKIN